LLGGIVKGLLILSKIFHERERERERGGNAMDWIGTV
jgi:hypothetical protein